MSNTRYVYGIYYDGEIVYTGSTKDMRMRWGCYKRQHLNPNSSSYNMKISQFMREKGFNNFSHQIIETFFDITEQDIRKYEGMWQETCKELGFNLLNEANAGNGSVDDINSIAYANHQDWKKIKVTCDLCGAIVNKGHIARHRKSKKCLNNRKAVSS